jgi:hypothetical protein
VAMVGDRRVTLLSSVLIIRLPWGNYVWQRPKAIIVEQQGRQVMLPIRDVTRRIELGLYGLGLLLTGVGWLRRRRKGQAYERS